MRHGLLQSYVFRHCFEALEGIRIMWTHGGYYLPEPRTSELQVGGGGKWLFFRCKELGEMVFFTSRFWSTSRFASFFPFRRNWKKQRVGDFITAELKKARKTSQSSFVEKFFFNSPPSYDTNNLKAVGSNHTSSSSHNKILKQLHLSV